MLQTIKKPNTRMKLKMIKCKCCGTAYARIKIN